MKTARRSFGKPWECQKPWPDDCFVQCGDSGIVLGKSGSLEKVLTGSDPLTELAKGMADTDSYMTAFFEAFPKNPRTFIRGEGKTIEEAEASAYARFERFVRCQNDRGHKYDRRGYTNGAGFCHRCGMFRGVGGGQGFRPDGQP